LCNIYSLEGEESDNSYFIKAESWLKSAEKYDFCKSYSTFLLSKNDSTIYKGIEIFEKIATSENAWYIRLAGFNALDLIKDLYLTKKKEAQENIKSLQLKSNKKNEIAMQEKELEKAEFEYARISSLIRNIKSKETDKNLLSIYGKIN